MVGNSQIGRKNVNCFDLKDIEIFYNHVVFANKNLCLFGSSLRQLHQGDWISNKRILIEQSFKPYIS